MKFELKIPSLISLSVPVVLIDWEMTMGAMANVKYNILTQISINFDQIH